jgi:uncharacterized membrane protein YgcG
MKAQKYINKENRALKALINQMEGHTMKTLAAVVILFSLLLASCSTTYNASVPYDEVYAVSGTPAPSGQRQTTVTTTTVETTTAYDADYYDPAYEEQAAEFDAEGYYDYEYASRVKRFHDDNPGFDYYSNYYTDNYYYTGSPEYIGTSIYTGCGYCGPSFSLGFGWGWGSIGYGWGYPSYYTPWYYDPWFYDPWYSYGWGYPYYPYWGYPYYGYGGSYWAGYWDGYYDGIYHGGGYYPEPYPGGSGYYYGPRGNRGGSSDGSNASGLAQRGSRTVETTQPVEKASRDSRPVSTLPVSESSTGKIPVNGGEAGTSYDRSIRQQEALTPEKPVSRDVAPEKPVTREMATDRPVTREAVQEKPAVREPVYGKPVEQPAKVARESGAVERNLGETVSPARRTEMEQRYDKPRSYTAPAYRTTPSRQEYSVPSTRDTRSISNEGAVKRTYTQTPERRAIESGNSSGSSNYAPARSTREGYSTPSTSSGKNYSAPASRQSYSAPSKSYSSPSSSGSSSPSRSSGSMGGGSSSGSSGARGSRR